MGWWAGAGGSKIKTKLSLQLGLAKLELGLGLAILTEIVAITLLPGDRLTKHQMQCCCLY